MLRIAFSRLFLVSCLIVTMVFATTRQGSAQAVPQIPTLKFVHPGVPLTLDDLNNVKAMIVAQKQPWYGGYQQLLADSHSQLTYQRQGPYQEVDRNLNGTGVNVNLYQWEQDMTAIGNLARLWYYTGNSAYAQKSHDILLAWATTQTIFGGYESDLDMGDYIDQFVTGADILRGTWPGWTDTDTTTVKNFFKNVYYPAAGFQSAPGTGGKGAYTLMDGVYLALFNDDQDTFNYVITQALQATQNGYPNTLATGEVGESLRDSGHAYDQWFCNTRMTEAAWSQGVDLYSLFDNRMLAIGEYHARLGYYSFSDLYGAQWEPDGSMDSYYTATPAAPYGSRAIRMAVNILRGAYNIRQGLPTPWMDLATQWSMDDMLSFSYEKVADTSTATPVTYSYPATQSVSTGLTDGDIGDASNAPGSTTYNNGIWTVKGAGSNIFTDYNRNPQTDPDNFHFVYMPITGDGTFIAKVNLPPVSASSNAVAGLAVRDTLTGIPNVGGEIGLSTVQGIPGQGGNEVFAQSVMHGWTNMFGGSNFEGKYAFNGKCMSAFCDWLPLQAINNGYWFKIERLGQYLNMSISEDGTSWGTVENGVFNNGFPATMYYGLMVSSGVSGSDITATFSHVAASVGDGNDVITVPAAPENIVGGATANAAILRWLPSYGATAYNVKRATSANGPFTTVGAGVTGETYTDTGLTDVGTYYYAVSATNSAGESANSPADALTFAGLPTAPVLTGMGADNQSSLSWTDPIYGVNNPLYFNLKRSLTSGGPYTTIAQVNWTLPSSTRIGNSYGDAPITNGTTYYYVVSTVDQTGESPNSNEVAVTPYAPLALSIDFQGGNSSVMASNEIAGWIPESNWNSAPNASGTASNLLLNNGTASNASVDWNAPAVGSTSIGDVAGDSRMMKGFLNSGLGYPVTVDVNNIPASIAQAGYDVYVYVDGDNSNNNTTNITLDGTTQSVTNLISVNYFGNYFQNNLNNGGNFVVFRGLNSSSIAISAQPDVSSVAGRGAPINGIEIVSYATDTLNKPILPVAPVVTGTPENGAVGLNWPYDSTGQGIYGVTQFNIKRSTTSGGPYTVIGHTTWNTPSGTLGNTYTDTTVVNGQTYYYIVTATNFNGDSPNSNEVGAMPFIRQALSIDFQGGSSNNGTPSPMQPAEFAGWIPLPNWNNAPNASGSASNMVLSDGTSSNASVSWNSPNTWSTPISETPGNARMMEGYLDSASGNTATVSVSNLSSAFITSGYDVYVYIDGDNGNNAKNGIYQIGSDTETGVDLGSTNFYGQFYQNNNGGGNYVVFRNVHTSSFTLTAKPLASDGPGGRAPINGISIVSYATGAVEQVNPPAAPVLSGTPANNAIGLSWPTSSTNVGISYPTSFHVKRSLTSGGPYSTIGTVTWTLLNGSLGNSYMDTTAVNGTTYYYVVTAADSGGESAASNEVSLIPAVRQGLSVDFQGGGSNNGNPSAMQPSEVAGWIQLPNWNNAPNASGSASNLVLTDGTVSTASISWNSNNTWSTPITENPGDSRMMKGYLDTNGAGLSGSTTTVSVSGIPTDFVSDGYDVYVYIDGENGSNSKTGQYTIGTSTLANVDPGGGNFVGEYYQNNNGAGNYVVFHSLTATSFTLTGTPLSTSGPGGRAPINGIQIVREILYPPAAPVLSATPENNAVGLTWPYNTANLTSAGPATSFNVQRSLTHGGPYTTIGTVTWTTPAGSLGNSFTDATAVNGTTYYYVITGNNSDGAGPVSNEVAVTPLNRSALSIDFQGGGSNNGYPTQMQSSEVAGWIPLANWNNAPNASGSASNLLLSDGTTTGVSTTWNSANTWSTSIAETAGNNRMIKGYLDGPGGSTSSLTVNNLPESFANAGYDVYVYVDGDNGSNTKTGQYTLAGNTLNSVDQPNTNFFGQFYQNDNGGGNYVLFKNVNSASFTLTATSLASDGVGGRAPINGISVVSYTNNNLTIQASATTLTYPASTNVIVGVPSGSGGTATGSITLYDGTTALGNYSLQGDGKAYIYVAPSFATGVHYLQAIYPGDSTHAPGASDLLQIIVSPASVNLGVSCWNASLPYGGNYNCTTNVSSGAGNPSGILNYTVDGVANTLELSNGNATLTVPTPNAGTHSVTFSFPAQGNFAASATPTESFTVTPAPTQIQLTPSSYYQSASAPLTLSVSLTSWSAGAPTVGTVSFYDGSVLLGTASAAANVTFNVPSPSVGNHSYSAAYTPNAAGNFAAVTSSAVSVQLTQ